jgi:SAM-dependent methyltransferase
VFQQFHVGRRILDFGCGAGRFLRTVRSTASSAVGIELQESFKEALNRDGIPCFSDISELPPPHIDTAFMFHVLEHLPDPLSVLRDLKAVISPATGILIVEVPHANDFLINQLKCQPFIDFTLWSQHLVLHTRDSLRKLLVAAGFSDIRITGVQRYGLANHINWLNEGKPGGHKAPSSLIETSQLFQAYESALAAQDFTDTLVAIAQVG